MLKSLVQIEEARAQPLNGGRTHSGRGKVVLFLPLYSGPPLGPPTGLLCLASPLLRAGYDVRIIDAKIEPSYLSVIAHEIRDAVCFGVSLLTGPMIGDAVEASRRVKQQRPDLPIVFGGWHPTLMSAQTLHEPFVDVVVRNQAEITFLEVVDRLARRQSPAGVAGCWFKDAAGIHQNPDRPAPRIADLPSPAYHLADFDAYERAGGGRKLPYATSVGCPYTCRYCTDTVFYKRRFNAYSPERVAREVPALVERFRIREVSLLDSNFLVNTQRALAIAQGFLAAGTTFKWTFQASTDLLCRMTDEEVRLLAASGVSHIGFGTESGSEKVLRAMDKRHQTIPDMMEAARKCQQAGIRATFNLIFGYPGETDADRRQTLRVMSQIAERYEQVTFSPNIFTPYPGIPVWEELERLGLQQPRTLQEWQNLALGTNVLPWMQGEPLAAVERSVAVFLAANDLGKTARRTASGIKRRLAQLLRRPLCWRLKHDFYRWPVEVWLFQWHKRLTVRRSLLTGQALGGA